eukprot:CAMPEP_0119270644 /NCGR_PEP_ID=MMETSP1329-20130426/7566_1 /TAXON_ID=114041 /ORGANISM="Genus nov. species nov., Strain RCC1024" /LENGTH=169 /DNA_ID=CAMNT_0007270669 /DNA_START=211 /DNA_END=717 /DNA_ORIENTATION=+
MLVHHESVDYDLADVDLTYTLEQLRDALANDCGSFKVFDDGEWKIMYDGRALEGERLTLLQHRVPAHARLEVTRVNGSNRPPRADPVRVEAAAGPAPTEVTARFDPTIDIDDAPHPLAYAGMKSRLRDAAAIRELAHVREEARHDCLRAVFAAVNDMLVEDATERELKV